MRVHTAARVSCITRSATIDRVSVADGYGYAYAYATMDETTRAGLTQIGTTRIVLRCVVRLRVLLVFGLCSLVFRLRLFLSQRLGRLELRRAQRWQVAGEQRDGAESGGRESERRRIARPQSEEERRRGPSGRNGEHGADDHAGGKQRARLAH